jgi:putative ABC transport system ATP-binding protein
MQDQLAVASHAQEIGFLPVVDEHFPRALANRPSVVPAEEPTAGLDKNRGRHVMELFRMVAHEHNGGVIVVTQDHRALDVFDAIYDIEDGLLTRRMAERETLKT